MKTKTKIPVSERALVARINRKLAHDGEKLYKSRTMWANLMVGDHYILDVERNFTSGQPVDLKSLGKKLGVLKPYERLADD